MRERECRAAKHPGDSGDLVHICSCVAAHPFRIAPIDGVNLVSPNLLAIRPGDPQVFRDSLKSVVRQFSCRKIVAEYRIQRVDQFAPGCDIPYSSTVRILHTPSPGCTHAQARRPDPP